MDAALFGFGFVNFLLSFPVVFFLSIVILALSVIHSGTIWGTGQEDLHLFQIVSNMSRPKDSRAHN